MARPVALQSEADRLKLRQLLDDALGAELQALEGSGQASEAVVKQLKAETEKVHRILALCCTTDAKPVEAAEAETIDQPMEDAELAALQTEVDSAWQRVTQLRAAAPATVSQQAAAQLAQLRPAEEAAADPPAPQAPSAAPKLAPAAGELQARLGDAADKLPTLRAKLTEALERLGRVVQALESVEPAAGVPPTPAGACTVSAAPAGEAGAQNAVFRKHLAGALQQDALC